MAPSTEPSRAVAVGGRPVRPPEGKAAGEAPGILHRLARQIGLFDAEPEWDGEASAIVPPP